MGEITRYDINFFGLDNSGKTSLIRSLIKADAALRPIFPTKGFEYKAYDFVTTQSCCRRKVIKLTLVDTGGQQDVRDFWPRRFGMGAATVFVLDAADENRFQEAFAEISTLLSNNDVVNRPFLVFANKQDLNSKIQTRQQFEAMYGIYSGFFAAGSALWADSIQELFQPLFEAAVDPKRLIEAQHFLIQERKKGVAYGLTVEQKFQKLAELQAAKQ